MIKVILIKPDMPDNVPLKRYPPEVHLGIGSIAGSLLEEGSDVSIIDNYLHRMFLDELVDKIIKEKPDWVGINCDLVSIGEVEKLASALRPHSIPVVIGGPEVSIHPRETLERVKADVAVIGEGEATVKELLQLDAFTPKYIKGVAGTAYLNNGQYFENDPRPLIKDLDEIPPVPRHLFEMDLYPRHSYELSESPSDLISTSRGCPFRCAFCSNEFVWGRRVRAMSPERVANEVEEMINNYGTRVLYFREDNFTIKKKRVYGICDQFLKRRIKLKWLCESRVDHIDEDLLRHMHQAGCRSIWFGVESGSQRILDKMHKDITLAQIKRAFRLCRKVGITPGASVMFGIPGETRAEMRQTLRFLLKISPEYVFFNPFLGIPGSAVFEEIETNNLAYQRFEGLVLPNNEVMTWPEKVSFTERATFLFYLFPPNMFRFLRQRGLLYAFQRVRDAFQKIRTITHEKS